MSKNNLYALRKLRMGLGGRSMPVTPEDVRRLRENLERQTEKGLKRAWWARSRSYHQSRYITLD